MTSAPEEITEPGGSILVLHERLARLGSQPETSHTEHGLTYLAQGSIRMLHGSPIEIGPGTVALVPAGVPHTTLGGDAIEIWLVSFCATCLKLDEGQPLMSPFRRARNGALPVVEIPESRRAHVVTLFREMSEECDRGAAESTDLSRSLLLLLLAEVRRAMPGADLVAPEGSLVTDALQFIQERCLDPISLRDVAAAVHRTPAHVTSTVKQQTGYSVGEWIRAGRVAEAAARLAHSDDSVDVIASHVGWRDTTHFIRQFRRAYGSTPAAWRREHRARHAGLGR